MQEINFNVPGKPIWINIKTGGKVLISYTFKFWSTQEEGEKKLFEFSGNNANPDDDKFKLINKLDLNEPIENYNNRIIHTAGLVNATEKESQPYSVTMQVFQCDTADQLSEATLLDEAKISGEISLSQGSIPFQELFAQLKKV